MPVDDQVRLTHSIEGHPSHAEWNLAPEEPGTSFNLGLKNAGLYQVATSSLKKSGRVLDPDALKQRPDLSQQMKVEIKIIMRIST